MSFKDLPIMQDKKKGVLLFLYTYVSKNLVLMLKKTCRKMAWTRTMVDKFEMNLEKSLQKLFRNRNWIGH